MTEKTSPRLQRKGLLLLLLLALLAPLTIPQPAAANYCYERQECPWGMHWECNSCYCDCPLYGGEPVPWGECGPCT